MRRALRVGIALVVLLSIGLAALAAWNRFPDIDWRLEPGWLLVGVASLSIFLLCHAELWRRVLAALGPELPRRTAYSIWSTSTLCRYVPTSLLLPVVRAAMAEREGVPKRICFASVVYELALGFTGALIVSAYFIIDLPDLEGRPERFAVLAIPLLAIAVLQPEIFHRVANAALERLGRQQLPFALGRGRVFEFVGLFSLTFGLAGLGVYGLAQTVHPIDGGDFVTVIGAYAVSTALSVMAFILPAGLVAREASLAVALSPVMPTAPAVAVAVLVRIFQLGLEIALTVITRFLARSEGAPSTRGCEPLQDLVERGGRETEAGPGLG